MTNKEKYPNAKVERNEHCKLYGGFYILLKKGIFLKRDGSADGHNCSQPSNTYFESQEIAQSALDKFMNPESTLSEIKSQLAEAKRLIGKKVSFPSVSPFIVNEIILDIVGERSSKTCDEFFNKHGYVIKVCDAGYTKIPYTPSLKSIQSVEVTRHNGEKYIAKDAGHCWKFGSAEISKLLIKDLYYVMSQKYLGNHQATKVTIADADFDLGTLKDLVDSEKEDEKNKPF